MSYLLDNIPFIKISSKKSQLSVHLILLIFIALMVFPLALVVYKTMMSFDKKSLIARIDEKVMRGHNSIYDYNFDLLDDYEIVPLKPVRLKPKMLLEDGSVNPEWRHMDINKYDYVDTIYFFILGDNSLKRIARERGAFRISDPNLIQGRKRYLPNNIPFIFVSIEKNYDGGYTIKKRVSLGIGYKQKDNGYFFLRDEPRRVYSETIHYLNENDYSRYHYLDGSMNSILDLLPPEAYRVDQYDQTHITSKYHSIDRQYRETSGTSFPSSGSDGTGFVYDERTETYYSDSERFITVVEKRNCKLGLIFIVVSTLLFLSIIILIFCYDLPSFKRKLQYSGYLWVSEDGENGLIFNISPIGKNELRILDASGERSSKFIFASDYSSIKLSDGRIMKLSCKHEEGLNDKILLVELDEIETIYKLHR